MDRSFKRALRLFSDKKTRKTGENLGWRYLLCQERMRTLAVNLASSDHNKHKRSEIIHVANF